MTATQVDSGLTKRIAELARLDLSEAEIAQFTTQLSEVLKYVEGLQAVDCQGVVPMTHPLELDTPLRQDVARPWPTNPAGQSAVMDSAPQTLEGGYQVPRVLG